MCGQLRFAILMVSVLRRLLKKLKLSNAGGGPTRHPGHDDRQRPPRGEDYIRSYADPLTNYRPEPPPLPPDEYTRSGSLRNF